MPDGAAMTGPVAASAVCAPDVEDLINEAKFGSFHVKLLVLGALIMLVDGYEVGVLGLVLPLLAKDFGVTSASLSWVLSAQQVGMVIGAYFLSPLADRFGRRPLAITALAAVGLSCLATLLTRDLYALATCRLVTGIFASTLIANMVAWTAEIAPTRHRATMVAVVLVGSSFGAIMGSGVQAFVLEHHGWRGAFWIGGLTPLALVPIALTCFPESPRFLAARNPGDPRIARFLRSAGRTGDIPALSLRSPARAVATGRVRELFLGGLAIPTVLLWLTFIASFVFISASFWKTTVFHDVIRLNWEQVALTTSIDVVVGAVAMLASGALIARLGVRAVVPTAFLVASVGAVLMGALAPGWGMFAALIVMAGAQHVAHANLSLIASNLYPTRIRATGVGWAYGAGRIASVVGPPFGAIALERHWGAVGYFVVLAVPLVVSAGLVALLLGRPGVRREPETCPLPQ